MNAVLYCPKCRKEVVAYAVSPGAVAESELSGMATQLEAEGKIVLWNPPPFGPHNCPACGSQLEET
ncbi:MAG: hypothetical protein ACTSU5_16325 [Promethearchaeota archaeon]